MNYSTYAMYRDQAINAGYLPKHVDSLTLPQLKKLVTTYEPGNDLNTILNKSNYATLKKFATTNYGLNPDVASKLGIERLKEYIQTESLYKQEGIVQNRLAEGPYYPGPLAAAQLNTPQLTYNEPSLYAPSITYSPSNPLYLTANPAPLFSSTYTETPAPRYYGTAAAETPLYAPSSQTATPAPLYASSSLYQPNYQNPAPYQPPFLTESVGRQINRALGNSEFSRIEILQTPQSPPENKPNIPTTTNRTVFTRLQDLQDLIESAPTPPTPQPRNQTTTNGFPLSPVPYPTSSSTTQPPIQPEMGPFPNEQRVPVVSMSVPQAPVIAVTVPQTPVMQVRPITNTNLYPNIVVDQQIDSDSDAFSTPRRGSVDFGSP